ncbi:response regulator [Natroniella sulfidigena]|uniref:sigma-54-dependent transcriptional regulator n=1 Tax=Natroniella sulfidigena TaxID=723921 RepID=UPI00200B68E2|nr:response regulator [Natroniella sulfidigena]MCK8817962.1 response regulator [Natroniella sulfidigena]
MAKVLVIDDEKNIRITLTKCLEKDYEVVTAVNGEDGLEKIEEGDFEIILLDMKLPGIDGMEVLKKIEELDSEASVIMITGFGTVKTAVEAMKLGALDYLRKPFSSDEIRGVVQEVLERRTSKLQEEELNSYEDYLNYAKSCINQRDFKKGEKYLQKAVALDTSKPEAFNLLGVILELRDKILEAQKKYRAALSLDPTYQPAKDNLNRTTKFNYERKGINLGDENQEGDGK